MCPPRAAIGKPASRLFRGASASAGLLSWLLLTGCVAPRPMQASPGATEAATGEAGAGRPAAAEVSRTPAPGEAAPGLPSEAGVLKRPAAPSGAEQPRASEAAPPAEAPRAPRGAAAGAEVPRGEFRAEDQPIRDDPRAYLEHVAVQTRRLEQYTLIFVREERRGLLGRLHPPETIRCWYRRAPFSVRMKWLNEDVKYGESTFTAGRENNAVRFVTRWWTPPLRPPPEVNRIDLVTPVLWGESKRPLTDFGLERMMERTLETLDEVGLEARLTYEGLVPFEPAPPHAHLIRIEIPPRPGKSAVQELYVDPATNLPLTVVLRKRNGALDGRYDYRELDTSVRLSDEDFLLDVERNPPAPQEPQLQREPQL